VTMSVLDRSIVQPCCDCVHCGFITVAGVAGGALFVVCLFFAG
jgi:hypothetical protein